MRGEKVERCESEKKGYWKLNDKEVEFCTLTVEELSFREGYKKSKKSLPDSLSLSQW